MNGIVLKKGSRSRGQIFSLDVLVALVPVVMLLGVGLQYLYEVQEEMKFVSGDYELESLSRAPLDLMVSKYGNVIYCDEYEDYLEKFLDTRYLDDDYVFYLAANYYTENIDGGSKPEKIASCELEGPTASPEAVQFWSSRTDDGNSLDSESLLMNKKTTASWKRFVLGNVRGGLSPGNITEVSLAVWERKE
ncbi:MAG: hypothetical protein JXB14_06105 [Candidatus Altiarchaeota archaeon]|nr:hypothetical protein [Candidatus Altiarchaeota archaeon]